MEFVDGSFYQCQGVRLLRNVAAVNKNLVAWEAVGGLLKFALPSAIEDN
jgi:hypothetical protein